MEKRKKGKSDKKEINKKIKKFKDLNKYFFISFISEILRLDLI
jgi:hypothetical protein